MVAMRTLQLHCEDKTSEVVLHVVTRSKVSSLLGVSVNQGVDCLESLGYYLVMCFHDSLHALTLLFLSLIPKHLLNLLVML